MGIAHILDCPCAGCAYCLSTVSLSVINRQVEAGTELGVEDFWDCVESRKRILAYHPSRGVAGFSVVWPVDGDILQSSPHWHKVISYKLFIYIYSDQAILLAILFFPCFFYPCVCASDLVLISMVCVFVCVCRNTPCCMKRPVSSSWLHYRQSWSTGGLSENAGGCVWSVSVLWFMWLQILVRGSVWVPTGMWLRRFFLRWKISCPIPWSPVGSRTPSKSFAFHSMATATLTLSRYKKHSDFKH